MQAKNIIPPEVIAGQTAPEPQKQENRPLLIDAGNPAFWGAGGMLHNEFLTADKRREVPLKVTDGKEIRSLQLPAGITLITSMTGGGKTFFLTELAARELHAGREVIFFTAEEMAATLAGYIAAKVHSLKTGEDTGVYKIISTTDPDGEKIGGLLKGLYFFNGIEEGITAGKIREAYQAHKAKEEKPLLLVDYVQLMSPEGEGRFSANWERAKQTAAELKGLRGDGFSIVLGAQLNREGLKAKTSGQAFHTVVPENLREAADLEQAADLILLAWIPRQGKNPVFFLRTLKGRRGINVGVSCGYVIKPYSRALAEIQPEYIPDDETTFEMFAGIAKKTVSRNRKAQQEPEKGDFI